MLDTRLDKDLISDPSLYTMLIRVGGDVVDIVIFTPMADNSLIYRSFKSQNEEADVASRLEEVVYDNPLMLSEFRRVVILTGNNNYTLIPAELAAADPRAGEQTYRFLYPDYEGPVETAPTSMNNATIVYGLEKRLAGFIRRTYPTATVMPHILPLLRYLNTRSGRSNSPRMLVNLRSAGEDEHQHPGRGQADIIVVAAGSLRQAVTVEFKCIDDLVYRILSSVQANSLDPRTDSILLAGDRDLREEISPILRKYHARVMPVIFPPEMFKAGREAMNAPFDLIVTPLI